MTTQLDANAIAWQLERMDEGATEREAIAALIAADESAPIADRIAAAFAVQLFSDIGAADMGQVRGRNASPAYHWPICASHDFCDANETMAAAFLEVMGRDILPDDDSGMTDSDCALWGQSWSIAKEKYLTD